MFYAYNLRFKTSMDVGRQNTEDHLGRKLKDRWIALLSSQSKSAGDDEGSILKWWDFVRDHYTDDTRHYHDLHHITTMFELMDQYMEELHCPLAVALAIYFHDVIYDPKASDNEENSADAFLEFASRHLDKEKEMCNQVNNWILLTKKHLTEAHTNPERFGSDDEHYFLDFDMQVLGWPAAKYLTYADQIRQEYIHISDPDYRIGRAQVLQKFLERCHIYATRMFREKYEEQARRNIREEMERLQI